MSGVHGAAIGHLVRRGLEVAQARFSDPYVQTLKDDAALYESTGDEGKIHDYETLPVVITALLTFLIVASIKYTVGEVMAALTMIESPTTTAIIEDKPPAYTDGPDAPVQKETPIYTQAEADVEVTLVPHAPITSKITTTAAHLTKIGGFRAKWRGLGISIVYHFMHSIVSNFGGAMLGFGLLGRALVYVFTSIGLARVHMYWTHCMIAHPVKERRVWRNFVPRTQATPILLPALVVALAQQATIILPMAVAYAVGIPDIRPEHVMDAADKQNCHMLALAALRLLAVPATLLFVAFAILLPATVTLTRIEALLLPEGRETIVPFDRQAIVGDIDMTARGSSKKIFVSAWRSFDRASRWRLVKLYVKMVALQFSTAFVGLHVIIAEMYLIGGDRLAVFLKSATAQLRLEAMEAVERAN